MDTNEELYRAVGRMEGKLDTLIDALATHVDDDQEVEKRVRALEKWKAYMIGLGAAAGAAGGKIITLFGGV